MQIIGIMPNEITAATAVPQFKLGTRGVYDHPTLGSQEFVYGQASGAVTGAGFVCVESNNSTFAMATTANTAGGQAGHGSRVGVAQAAMTNGQFGWFQIYGRAPVRTVGPVAVGTRLNTTATAGAIDDDGTAGARVINGVVLHVAAAGAETNQSGMLSYPTVGATI